MEATLFNQASEERAHSNSRSFKTSMCTSFARFGCCKYKSDCKFAHGVEDLRRRVNPPKFKTVACKNDSQGIPCPYGAKCDFIHKTDVANQQNVQNMWCIGDNTPSNSMLMVAFNAIDERTIMLFDKLTIGTQISFATSPTETLAGNQYFQACPALDNPLLGDLNKQTYQNTSNSATANSNIIEELLPAGLLTNVYNTGGLRLSEESCSNILDDMPINNENFAPGTPPTAGNYIGPSLFQTQLFNNLA